MRTPKTIWRVYNRLGISWDPAAITLKGLKDCTCPIQWDQHFPNAKPHRVVKYILDKSRTARNLT